MTTTNARIFARTQRLTAACTVPLALLALIAVACSNEPRSSNQDVSEGFTSRTQESRVPTGDPDGWWAEFFADEDDTD